MYTQHRAKREIAIDRHRSLIERGGRKAFVRDKCLAHTQKGKKLKNISEKTRYSRI